MSKKIVGILFVIVVLALWIGSSFAVFKGVMFVLNWEPDVKVINETTSTVYMEKDMDIDFVESFVKVFAKLDFPMTIVGTNGDDRLTIEVQEPTKAVDILRETSYWANFVEVDYKTLINPSFEDFTEDTDTEYTQLTVSQGKSGYSTKQSVALEFFTSSTDPMKNEFFEEVLRRSFGDDYDFALIEKEFMDFLENKGMGESYFNKEELVKTTQIYHTISFDELQENFYRFYYSTTFIKH